MKKHSTSLPHSQKWLVDGFCWYSRGMIKKQFSSFAVSRSDQIDSIPENQSIVVFANHSSWWDPISAMLLRQTYFPERILYAPIDAEQLENYSVLKKMGFYGIQLNSYAGAQQFLKTSQTILKSARASIWITPEGRFCDVRDHSQALMPGLAHLASKVQSVTFLPLAIEYTFWVDAKPHIFCQFGEPLFAGDSNTVEKAEWAHQLESALRETQKALSKTIMQRDDRELEYLINSTTKKTSLYDFARSWAAWAKGRKFDPRHSASMRNTLDG